ncbi:MAG: hypothetical protein KKD05_08635 [Candidatus Omnitrophica bacterium]|nr:hypothetical protein [Candidatus Omnitrophota bacterium]
MKRFTALFSIPNIAGVERKTRILLKIAFITIMFCGILPKNILFAQGANRQGSDICIYSFVNNECSDCEEIYEKHVVKLIEKYRLKAIALDVNSAENYALLVGVEKYFQKNELSFPCVLLNDDLMGKEDIISGWLEKRIAAVQTAGMPFFDFAEIKNLLATNPPLFKLKNTTAVYFFKESCKKCSRVEKSLLYLEKKYYEFNFQRFDIADKNSCLFYQYLTDKYHLIGNKALTTPALFIGNEYLTEKQLYYLFLESTVQKYRYQERNSEYAEFLRKDKAVLQGKIAERFKRFSAIAVITAGIIDGVNPCAFAAIVFFVTSLLILKRRRREIILVGISFISAVFFTYLLVGLGGIRLLQSFLTLPIIEKIVSLIYAVLAGVLFVLAYLSFRDIFMFIRQRKKEVILKLSDKQSSAIRKTITEKLQGKHYIAGAIISGVFVSLTELACTGQIYLPTIMYILNVPDLRKQALAYLILYNIAFIIPLIVIFILALLGLPALYFVRVSKKFFIWGKLLLGLLFICLGVILLLTR